MGAVGWGSDGGGRMQAVGDGGLSARRRRAHRRLAGARQNGATKHETKRKRYQNKERRKTISPSCSKRKERHRRKRSTTRAELRFGFLVWRRAARGRARVSSAVWRGARGVPFIGTGGGAAGALEVVDGHRRGGRH
jgi:hypothetical protein